MPKYELDNVVRIIRGYRKLDAGGALSELLLKVSRCTNCSCRIRPSSGLPPRKSGPVNALVRPLPLTRLSTKRAISNYTQRIKRDDTFLRNLFSSTLSYRSVLGQIGSAKFSIGLLPWLDRCMLVRSHKNTKLMIIGIDYKHFPVFHSQPKDHNFPLDSYLRRNNIWGPTWRRFWTNLLDTKYNDAMVNKFIATMGVYMTNSMLCFGPSKSPRNHNYKYLECCRGHIAEQIRIVKPEIIVSFGDYGCRNVATMLSQENTGNDTLRQLADSTNPLRLMRTLLRAGPDVKNGIRLRYNSRPVTFWPLYQPAWSHLHGYPEDYEVLRRLLGLPKPQ